MNNNKNGWIVKFLATCLWALMVVVMGFMFKANVILAENVISNDKESRTRDTQLERKFYTKVEEIKEYQHEMKEELMREQHSMKKDIIEAIRNNGR